MHMWMLQISQSIFLNVILKANKCLIDHFMAFTIFWMDSSENGASEKEKSVKNE